MMSCRGRYPGFRHPRPFFAIDPKGDDLDGGDCREDQVAPRAFFTLADRFLATPLRSFMLIAGLACAIKKIPWAVSSVR